MKFLMNISDVSYIMISSFAIKTGIDYSESVKVLEELSQGGFLEKLLAVRCPECGLLLDIVQPEDLCYWLTILCKLRYRFGYNKRLR